MPCYKPMIIQKINKKSPNEKVKINIVKNLNPKYILDYDRKSYNYLPCGKCIGCKLENSRNWAIRAELETKYTENNYFITLTYSGKYIPINKDGKYTIKQADLKKFIKDLRKYWKYHYNHDKIKYLASSEYGSKYGRPHYHICFFNLPINDLEKVNTSERIGEQLYVSSTINKIWKKGMHRIGITTRKSAGYTVRYSFKKLTKINYEKHNIEPEKLYMSNGIGLKYYSNYKHEIYKNDTIYLGKGEKVKPPRYYDKLYEKENAAALFEIKKNRMKTAEIITNELITNTNLPYTKILGDKQHIAYTKIKNLKRNLKNNN